MYRCLQDEERPRDGVEYQVEPVDRPHEPSGEEHREFFPYMGRIKRRKPQRKARYGEHPPRDALYPLHEALYRLHSGGIIA